MILLEISIAVTIIYLDQRSTALQGFVEVPAAWSQSSGLFTHRALWTTFPALMMGLYQRLLFDPILANFFARQPYVELRRDQGSTASRTIMLDYMSKNEFTRPFSMFRNGHFHLVPCALFSLLISFLLGPLSANLFQDQTVLYNATTSFQVLSSFDVSLYSASVLANNLSFGTAIQWAGASINHGAELPTWTIQNATFPQLAINYTDASTFGSNYSLHTNAWSGVLDCVAYNDSFELDSNNAAFNFIDRGCAIQMNVTIQPQKASIYSWMTHCPESPGFNRISFLSSKRDYPQTDITETSFVSCIPRYLSQPGTLQIQNGSIDFNPGQDTPSDIDPNNTWLDHYGDQLLLPAVLDPDANFAGTDFTKLIYDYSNRVHGEQNSLSPAAIINATSEAFQSVFSIMSDISLRRTLDQSQAPSIDATVSTVSTRLFVYWVFEYVILSFMVISVILVFIVALYSHLHPSILHEANDGLISYATIAHQSDLAELIDYTAELSRLDKRTISNQTDGRTNRANSAGDQRQINENATGADQHRFATAGPWNREIAKTLKERKILEEERWRGNWKVHDWGGKDEQLVRCQAPLSS
ncbi:hypothetical protein MMC10_007314 [Thelotrema lepadinum]|nr:hypothetical protein [Thelotrema lepadinum]